MPELVSGQKRLCETRNLKRRQDTLPRHSMVHVGRKQGYIIHILYPFPLPTMSLYVMEGHKGGKGDRMGLFL